MKQNDFGNFLKKCIFLPPLFKIGVGSDAPKMFENSYVLCSRWFKSAGGAAFENFRETLHGYRSVSFEIMRTM